MRVFHIHIFKKYLMTEIQSEYGKSYQCPKCGIVYEPETGETYYM